MALEEIRLLVWTIWQTPSILLISVSAGLSNILLTFDADVMPVALFYICDEFKLVNEQKVLQKLIICASTIGAVFGAAIGTWTSDQWGRQKSILLADKFLLLGTAISLVALHHWVLIFGRFLLGIGIGIVSMTMPLYVSEFSPPQIRSALITLNGILGTLGTFSSDYVTEAFTQCRGSWRWILGIAGIVPLAQHYLMRSLPDSPIYLLRKGYDIARREENPWKRAYLKVMANARSGNALRYIYPGDQAEAASHRLLISLSTSRIAGKIYENYIVKLRSAFQSRHVTRMIFAGISVNLAQQMVGIDKISKFTPNIMHFAGYHAAEVTTTFSHITMASSFITLVINSALVERYGRKRMLMLSLVVIFIIHIAFSFVFFATYTEGLKIIGFLDIGIPKIEQHLITNQTCFALDCMECINNGCGYCTTPGNEFDFGSCLSKRGEAFCNKSNGLWFDRACPNKLGILAVCLLIIFVITYSLAMGKIPSTLNTELYPARYRGLGGGIATITMWTSNVIYTLTFSQMTKSFYPWAQFSVHALLSFISLIAIDWLVPRTTNRPMEDIDHSFEQLLSA